MNRVKEFRKELGISQLELAKDKGLEKIQSKRIPVLNAALFFLLISFPQLLTNPVQWKFSIFLVVTIISSLAYFYNFYQVVKEVDQKQLI